MAMLIRDVIMKAKTDLGQTNMDKKTKKIEFWMEGRGGKRSEKKIVELPIDYYEPDIKQELDDWLDSLNCHSEFITYGWKEIP